MRSDGYKQTFGNGTGNGQRAESGEKRDGCLDAATQDLVGFWGGQPIRMSGMWRILRGARYGGKTLATSGLLAAPNQADRQSAEGDLS